MAEVNSLQRPNLCTAWVWLHHSIVDLDLWQNCIVAAYMADAKDPVGTAHRMYCARGGTFKPPKRSRRKGAPRG